MANTLELVVSFVVSFLKKSDKTIENKGWYAL